MHLNSSFYHLFVVVVCCCLFVVVSLFVVGIECRNGMPKSMQQGRDDVTKFYMLEMEEEGMEGGGGKGMEREGVEGRKEWRGGRSGGEEGMEGGGGKGMEGRKEWRGGRDRERRSGGEQKMEERKGWREESERRECKRSCHFD